MVFHPLLVITYLVGVFAWLSPETLGINPLKKLGFSVTIFIIFFYTFLIPTVLLYWLKRFGIISEYTLSNRKERPLPLFLVSILFFVLGGLVYFRLPIFQKLGLMFATVGLLILLIALISFFWQISAHAAGMGGILGTLLGAFLLTQQISLIYAFLVVLIITGFVLSARLALQAHTPAQIYVGSLLGLLVTFCSIIFIQ